jgi:hypothetical protein
MCTMPIPIFGTLTITFLVMQLLSFMNCVSTSHFCIFITMEFFSFWLLQCFYISITMEFLSSNYYITSQVQCNLFFLYSASASQLQCNFKLVATFGKVSLQISFFCLFFFPYCI